MNRRTNSAAGDRAREAYSWLRGVFNEVGDRVGLGKENEPDVAMFNLASEFPDLVARVRKQAESRRPVVLIDGHSGAGKSTLAARLADALGYLVVSLDDFYPGWLGLAEASRMVARDVLAPHAPGYRRWDWQSNFPAEWVSLDAASPIIVEGSGAITPESAKLATSTIWFARPEAERKELALRRDGDMFRPHWDIWAEQEQAHWDQDHPDQLADTLVVDIDSWDGLLPGSASLLEGEKQKLHEHADD